MFEYVYQRELVSSGYNINNRNRVDANGDPIFLSTEISDYFPEKIFKITCDGASATICFQKELSLQEKADLDLIVENHKNNT